MDPQKIQILEQYFEKEPDVVLAFLFGSTAKGRETEDSDVDIAVYLKDSSEEDRIWREATRLLQKEVDLVMINEAPATLISQVFKTGIPLAIKDRTLYWELYLSKSLEAEDFAEFTQSYWEIYQRAKSLTPEDKTRLLERVQFLDGELQELDKFRNITFQEYEEEKSKRRDMERWTENIMNATIDIAKVILASEKRDVPKTYEDALGAFAVLVGFDEEKAERFSNLARLRNMLAHEYLDILYGRIRNFIEEFPELYEGMSRFIKEYTE